jgi:thioredoxin 1
LSKENRDEKIESGFQNEEEEIEKIRSKKMKELVQRANTIGPNQNYPPEPIMVSDETFERFVNEHPIVVVDCWAPWCGPCRMVTPIVENLAKDSAGKIVFGKLNVDENPQTVRQFGIMSIPTFLIIKQGKEVDRIIGAAPRQQFEFMLQRHLRSP